MMLSNCGAWTARRSNQPILKEINPEYSLEGLMLKLKLQYPGHLMWRADSLKRTWWWKRLKAGGEGDDRGWAGWMASLTWWPWVWANSGRWQDREDWRTAVHGIRDGCDLATNNNNNKKHTKVSRGTHTIGNTEGNTFKQHYTLLPKWSWDSSLTHPHIFFLYLSANFRRTSK